MQTTRKPARMVVVATSDRQLEETLREQMATEYRVECVRRGAEAILQMLEKEIDLLLVDIDMNGQIGTEILPVIRRLRPRLPVILISDDFTYRIRKTAAEQGVTFQSVKPRSSSEAHEIINVVDKIIAHKEGLPIN
ncbi:MAG TPA: response regulator [bacterium]|nr:response regulator [bacterium]HQG44741.1 response regulator [bacterium]HQI47826.1 response regulator [bacterium]HQJ64010.1 response regulator [bacterium]